MSDKIPIAIYRVRDEIKLSDIVALLDRCNYNKQTLNVIHNEWNLLLYYSKGSSHIKWKDFIRPIVAPNQDILASDVQLNESMVLLFEHKDQNVIYSVVAGNAYFTLAEYFSPDFGLSILSRIIRKDDKVLKSTKEATLSGGVFGEIKFFRQNYNIYENESFGSFYQELKTLIDKDILQQYLGFSIDDLKRDSLCIAKSSFKITKSVDFSQLITILNGFEAILTNLSPIDLNNVRKLNRQLDKDVISKLRVFLANKLYQNYRNHANAFNFDICHPEFEKYLTADHYLIKKGSKTYDSGMLTRLTDFKQLCDIISESDGIVNSLHKFVAKYDDVTIESYDANSILLTRGRVAAHIIADLQFGNDRYFYIENAWYQINDKYVKQLNEECASFIYLNYHSLALLPWTASFTKENEYNAQYFGTANRLVLDKIICENIELCDFLAWDDKSLYLYHVKIGMGNTMRDLCSQIFISAQRIKRDVASNLSFAAEFYDRLREKIGDETYFDTAGKQTNSIPKKAFIELFRKEITFVLVVHDPSVKQRTIREIEKYQSNIAKLSIAELYKKMKGIDVPLHIVQV